MRVAVAGLGSAAVRAHLPALEAAPWPAQLVASADPDEHRRLQFSALRPDVPVFASAARMLDAVQCDVLVVAAPPRAHPSLVELGFSAGVDVLCEKPLALDREGHRTVAAACAMCPERALVSVHQYRYAGAWRAIARWARTAEVLHRPCTVRVDVDRTGFDAHAASAWRADRLASGGMLADTGVHFLALARAVHPGRELLAVSQRVDDGGRELSTATYQVGSGIWTIRVWNGAARRRSRVRFTLGAFELDWHDQTTTASVGARTLRRRRAGALTDRAYVDSLYRPLYFDLVRRWSDPAWRTRRTAESLSVGNAVVELLHHTKASAA